jgi:isoleucyl-tRNA synthetase
MSGEILERIRDAYKKIRYTLRFLLGNLYDFNPEEDMVPYEKRLEIDRWIMHRLASLIGDAEEAYDNYEFHKIYHLIHSFCISDLSSFYIDVLKDRLYTSWPSSLERRSAQSSIYEVTKDLLRLLSPVIPHTAEEAWRNLPGEKEKACELAFFPDSREYDDQELELRWEGLLKVRQDVLMALEEKREAKLIGNSLEAKVVLYPRSAELKELLERYQSDLATLFLTSQAEISNRKESPAGFYSSSKLDLAVVVDRADGEKCERCWIYFRDVGDNETYPSLCSRCCDVMARWEGGG